jgi:hypothetical protein
VLGWGGREGWCRPREAQGGEERTGPYVAAVELKAAAEGEPERIEPLGAPSRWIKPIGMYAPREIAHAEDSTSYG